MASFAIRALGGWLLGLVLLGSSASARGIEEHRYYLMMFAADRPIDGLRLDEDISSSPGASPEVTRVRLQGSFQRAGWTLRVGAEPITRDPAGKFALELNLGKDGGRFDIEARGPAGESERVTLAVVPAAAGKNVELERLQDQSRDVSVVPREKGNENASRANLRSFAASVIGGWQWTGAAQTSLMLEWSPYFPVSERLRLGVDLGIALDRAITGGVFPAIQTLATAEWLFAAPYFTRLEAGSQIWLGYGGVSSQFGILLGRRLAFEWAAIRFRSLFVGYNALPRELFVHQLQLGVGIEI